MRAVEDAIKFVCETIEATYSENGLYRFHCSWNEVPEGADILISRNKINGTTYYSGSILQSKNGTFYLFSYIYENGNLTVKTL